MIKNKKGVCGLGSFYVLYTGSVQFEKPGYRGISHLIEHCIADSSISMEHSFSKYGIDSNAYPDFFDHNRKEKDIFFNNKFSYNEFCEFVKEKYPKLNVSVASKQ